MDSAQLLILFAALAGTGLGGFVGAFVGAWLYARGRFAQSPLPVLFPPKPKPTPSKALDPPMPVFLP